MGEDWRAVGERVRNWGRWGPEDQLGTLNFLTPEHTVRAASLVRKGRRISLGNDIDGYGPQGASGLRRNPMHFMTMDGGDQAIREHIGDWGGPEANALAHLLDGPMRYNDDWILMPTQATTQWDALSHVYYDGLLYNGFDAATVTSLGAKRDGIDRIAHDGHIIGRGVLLDVARHRGLPRLEPGTAIFPDELDDVAARQGVEVGAGDIVVVRTGWQTLLDEGGDLRTWAGQSPGLSWRCAEWLHEHRCAAVAADNIGVEVHPFETDVILLFHLLTIRDMGMMLGEIWNLEELGRDCSQDGVYDFQLIAPALRISGGVGTPINPVALK